VSVVGYMLTVDPDNRPDIFQVSFIAFRIAGTNCPVENLNVRMQCLSNSLLYAYLIIIIIIIITFSFNRQSDTPQNVYKYSMNG